MGLHDRIVDDEMKFCSQPAWCLDCLKQGTAGPSSAEILACDEAIRSGTKMFFRDISSKTLQKLVDLDTLMEKVNVM